MAVANSHKTLLEKRMKTTHFLNTSTVSPSSPIELEALPQFLPVGNAPGKYIRHILLGEPDAVRQTIYRLHALRYTETTLWSPVLQIQEPLTIEPVTGEAISLLRKQL